MFQLCYSKQAVEDLFQIQKYISHQSGSIKAGKSFTQFLRSKCRDLASTPGRVGVARPELEEMIRSHPVGNYIIFFRYRGPAFEVVTIVEGHRDIATVFSL